MNLNITLIQRAAMTLLACAAPLGLVTAAEPDGYYDACQGKSGETLLRELGSAIDNHTVISYDGLLTAFLETDADEDGKLIDMYSTKRWNPGEKCGNYKKVGDCYNREHSFPKSWFDDKKPMYSDLFHLYPTDGKVNGERSNLPFGECDGGTYVSSSGSIQALGKKGASTFPGYTGTVFEPDDMYKGDFARSYFYMAARYNTLISSWSSPMLGGNTYPAFSSWAVDLLMKWHRQDPVDEKERRRNDAVYARQHNRNPFIDYPDLAEHIWGDEKSTPWSMSGGEPAIIRPVNGAAVNLGYASASVARTYTVDVLTSHAEGNVSVAVSGAGFSVSPASVSAAAANQGTAVSVTANHAAVGVHTGVLTVTCGELVARATLSVTTVAGIGAEASRISDEGFDLTWINIDGPDAVYELHVAHDGVDVDGFPEAVDAADERYVVSGLEPSTTYSVYFITPAGQTPALSVTTAEAVPFINVVAPGELNFVAAPGEPSAPMEMTVETAYIDGNLTVNAGSEPFEVSSDKTVWSQTATLLPGEDRFWLRVGAAAEGHYDGVLRVSGGDIEWDDDMTADVTSGSYFFEDFEKDLDSNSFYHTGSYTGSACEWKFTDVGNPKEHPVSGSHALRFGKTSTSSIEMAEDLGMGAGIVTFQAKKWNSQDEAAARVHLEYSRDGGMTWTGAAEFEIADTDYKEYSARVNVSGPVRLRARQSEGKRWHLDDFAVTPTASLSADVESDVNDSWDAYCTGGKLVIENHAGGLHLNVYSVSGLTLYSAPTAVGTTVLTPGPGLYIVATDTHSRRVLVH